MAAFRPDKTVQNVFKRKLVRWTKDYRIKRLWLNTLLWWRKCCSYGSWEGHSLCSFWRNDKYVFNSLLQNTLDVTVTALAVQNKREHPNRVKGFVKTVVPNYCDPTFASHFRMKRKTFQVKDNPLHTSETVIMIYYGLIIFIVSIRLIIGKSWPNG